MNKGFCLVALLCSTIVFLVGWNLLFKDIESASKNYSVDEFAFFLETESGKKLISKVPSAFSEADSVTPVTAIANRDDIQNLYDSIQDPISEEVFEDWNKKIKILFDEPMSISEGWRSDLIEMHRKISLRYFQHEEPSLDYTSSR